MGLELTTTPLQIKRFLGLNTKISDTKISTSEASALQNVNIDDGGVMQRLGSIKLNSVAFKEKTDATAKPITGLYQARLGNVLYNVGTGGDAFKQFTGGNFVDRTGSVTITDDKDNLASFATFYDGSTVEVIIAAFEQDAPIKWTGSGNAQALATPPGNFKFPVVHKNKLWVWVDDIIYFSGLRNGESWDLANDLIRISGNGTVGTGLAVLGDRLVAFKPEGIWMISGSSNRDLFVEQITTEGCASGYSIQPVTSRRYGNILVFLGTDGVVKGFNGSKNLITIGDPIIPLFAEMSNSRRSLAVAVNYKKRNQYLVSLTYSTGTQHNQIVGYDYFNDIYSAEDGRPLSSMLYHTGIKANAMAMLNVGSVEMLVTGGYDGFALRQDIGLLDAGTEAVVSKWQTGKLDFGSPTRHKMLTDLAIATTQSSATTMGVTATTLRNSGTSAPVITSAGGLWGSMIWGVGLWSAPSTKYTQCELTPTSGEDAVAGRWIMIQLSHSEYAESMKVNELDIGVTDLGHQPEWEEAA